MKSLFKFTISKLIFSSLLLSSSLTYGAGMAASAEDMTPVDVFHELVLAVPTAVFREKVAEFPKLDMSKRKLQTLLTEGSLIEEGRTWVLEKKEGLKESILRISSLERSVVSGLSTEVHLTNPFFEIDAEGFYGRNFSLTAYEDGEAAGLIFRVITALTPIELENPIVRAYQWKQSFEEHNQQDQAEAGGALSFNQVISMALLAQLIPSGPACQEFMEEAVASLEEFL